ncbi:MAG: hypothetical protein WCK32_08860 [Chlorobiaceae bacterium]
MANLYEYNILENKGVGESEFVEFWAKTYVDKHEVLYSCNIGNPLTPKSIRELFEWKNSGPISEKKLLSIQRNYIDTRPACPNVNESEKLMHFITAPGGAIWRIFWLHCNSPETYPIFDQHVYRAMKKITTGFPEELPATDKAKAKAYVHEYLPFHTRFSYPDKKKLDEALWSYGKVLKSNLSVAI